MHRANFKSLLAIVLVSTAGDAIAAASDHREFGATLHAPYTAEHAATAARTFTLSFDYPMLAHPKEVGWQLDLSGPGGQLVRRWQGVQRLTGQAVQVQVRWDGGSHPPSGVYLVRMRALAGADAAAPEVVEQSWEIAVGSLPAAPMPPFAAMGTSSTPAVPIAPGLAARAPAALPYTVYFANLHSQTNHSDGGGALAGCSGGQAPQSADFGPFDAYAYAKKRGLDILMTSEHNHMYDGSDGTDPAARPDAARALYRSGLTAARDFNAANPGFLAVYGMEWGVINNGGHMNIFNSPDLLAWEVNAAGQLLGDTQTAKGDYAALYSLMRQRGWIGQFNHPAAGGQFMVGGAPLGYTVDGDQAMVLCEVLNTSAFSRNTSETETGRSNYEIACNKALEAGFHVAFSSNQDNHCANWGASYTNRTGVLLPNGVALSPASFLDALRARRVFATMDKTSQLVLTANGRIMGERFSNSGPLNLVANFASSGGQTAATVTLFEGVPGRHGTVAELSRAANTIFIPSVGEHFYYARVTQADGKMLWSAPVWVSQKER